jgi:hypothetical protein
VVRLFWRALALGRMPQTTGHFMDIALRPSKRNGLFRDVRPLKIRADPKNKIFFFVKMTLLINFLHFKNTQSHPLNHHSIAGACVTSRCQEIGRQTVDYWGEWTRQMEWLHRLASPMPGQCKTVIIHPILKFEAVIWLLCNTSSYQLLETNKMPIIWYGKPCRGWNGRGWRRVIHGCNDSCTRIRKLINDCYKL